jgi:hypothetical protein
LCCSVKDAVVELEALLLVVLDVDVLMVDDEDDDDDEEVVETRADPSLYISSLRPAPQYS